MFHYGDYLVKDTRHSKPKVTDCEDDQIITVEYYDDDQITVAYTNDQDTVEYCDDDRLTIDYTDDNESRTYVHDHPYYNDNSDNLNVGFINVNFLENKVLLPDFEKMINNFDVFACAETKLDFANVIDVENYTFFSSERTKISGRTGGVGVFIKNAILDHYVVINCVTHCNRCAVTCNTPNTLYIRGGGILFVVVYILYGLKGQNILIIICLNRWPNLSWI